ncbi:alpha/beta fold hydrolase [Actibacterium sp. XHP0104]|uniref:alpha/beta fold hydrolase n=1 Tax=Actibacterium sp. XHP0104 TaxID=2984335 RepID=UPI0021E7806E|nr:alpha/beta hydrolase [Actibacterium sp. XHP0104]MCV2880948.1 alpha/beta hydrolase [Actibacterium sp. XHP0104]
MRAGKNDVDHIAIADKSIALRRAGLQGPPVICLHSSASHSGQYRALLQELGSRYRVVAPDLHGYGRSEAFTRDGRPWFEHDTAVVKALLDEFDGEQVHLVGHSLGGAAAVFSACRWPGRIASLTLYEPALFGLLPQHGHPAAAEADMVSAAVHGYLVLGQPEQAGRSFVDHWAGTGTFDALDARSRDYIARTIGRVADDWAGTLPDLPGQFRLGDCAGFEMPVQVLRGAETRPSTGAIADLLSDTIPGAVTHVVPSADHMGPVTRPDLVNPLIVRFLDELTQRAGLSA